MGAKVSVIIPSYNHALYLEQCVRTALAQSCTDLEVILVDDRSTDNSLEIASAIDDPRLKVHQNTENLGTYKTLNVALRLATGDWIAVLNSDDVWAPTKLESQMTVLESSGLEWSYCLGSHIDEGGNPLSSVQAGLPPEAGTLAGLLYENQILASSLVFRRGAIEFDETARYSGDWIALLQLAARGGGARVAEVLTFWRQHETNSYLRSPGQVAEEIRLRESILAELRAWLTLVGHDGVQQARTSLSLCAVALSALHILVGNGGGAKFSAMFGFRLKPGSIHACKRLVAANLPGAYARWKLWGVSSPLEIDHAATRPLFDLTEA